MGGFAGDLREEEAHLGYVLNYLSLSLVQEVSVAIRSRVTRGRYERRGWNDDYEGWGFPQGRR